MHKKRNLYLIISILLVGTLLVFSRADNNQSNELYDAVANDSLTTVYVGEHQDSLDNLGTKTIHYFTGSNDIVDHNNVKLGNTCWQILRTTDTGGVKMIYNGEYDSTNKCNTSRGNHTGFVGTSGTTQTNVTTLNGGSYKYAASFTWSGTTFTLVNPTSATWSDSTYTNLVGKYTCKSSSTTCSTLYYVGSRYSSAQAYTASYTIGSSVNRAYIGTSAFNANRYSPGTVGYMFNKSYDYVGNTAADSDTLYGEDVTYSNGTYTLTNTSTTKNTTHHYSCNNTTGTCSTVRFYYYNNYYIELSGVANIETAVNQMLYNNDVNTYNSAAKALIESWYGQTMTNYTSLFEDAVYCNDRTQTNASTNGWNKSGSLSTNMYFKDYTSNTTLKCNAATDQFTIANTSAQLTYPVGLATYPEMNLFPDARTTDTTTYWLMSPSSFGSTNVNEWDVSTVSFGSDSVHYNYGIRPVVSLKSGIEYTSGTGSQNDPYEIDTDTRPKIKTQVTNGTITATSKVTSGANKTISYNPKSGYVLKSVRIDGQKVNISSYPSEYTFTNVTEDHTISVYFSKSLNSLYDEVAENPLASIYNGQHQDSLDNSGTETIYYFTGSNDIVNHNNVKLGDTCWQILRTTDTGGVKMIYNGEYDSTNKCNTSRGNHTGFVGTAGSDETLSGSSYKYADSFNWNGTTFTLVNPSSGTWSESTAANYVSKYTCKSSKTSCSRLYYIGPKIGSNSSPITKAYTTSYTIGDTNYAQIGTSAFNANSYSPALSGYMFKNLVIALFWGSDVVSDALYGSNVVYSNGTYTLTNTTTTLDNTHHYSCNNTTGTCDTVRYYYYKSGTTGTDWRYLKLTGEANVETVVNQMLYDNDINHYNSAIKSLIDIWYAKKMTNYTSLLEDVVYCNDRTQINSSTNGWKPNGGNLTTSMYFKNYASNTTLKCEKVTDQFAVGNSKAELTYPVGLATRSEMDLLSNNLSRTTGSVYWSMSPSYFTGHLAAYGVSVSDVGAVTAKADREANGVRPVVSLKEETEYSSGTGTMNDPYEIDTRPKITTKVVNGEITQSSFVTPGSDKTITYSPDSGYALMSVIVDGVKMSINDYSTSYTFTNVNESHTIKVVYIESDSLYGTVARDPLTSVYSGDHQDSLDNSGQEPIYYFTGSDDIIDNNNIRLGGKCWQILRTTDTGGVKMIYNGEYDETDKCTSSRGDHKGIVSSGSTINKTLSSSYKYGDSFTWDGTSFTLTNVINATWSDSTYEDLLGKYTCASTSNTCSTLYRVNAYYSSTAAKTQYYTISNTNRSQIGKTQFNHDSSSLAMVGYMFNKTYKYTGNAAADSGSLYGTDVIYSNGTYTLTSTSTTKDKTHHYSCNNATGTCDTVRYYYYNNYYVSLSGMENIEEFISDLLYNDDVNKNNSSIKSIIEAWYSQELSKYTSLFEDAIYCNNRSQYNASTNGWNPIGNLTTLMYFGSGTSTLTCNNVTDQFAVGNAKAKNKYPVGLATYPEMNLLGNATARATGEQYWLGSPYEYEFGYSAYERAMTSTGELSYSYSGVSGNYGIRPVVSLKPGTKYVSGTGSQTDPYVIEFKPTITTEVEHGTITATSQVTEGSNKTINYSPENGYKLKSIKVDGQYVSIDTHANSYTFNDITDSHTIKVVYQPINNLYDVVKEDATENGLGGTYSGTHQDSLDDSGTDAIYYYGNNDDIVDHHNVRLGNICWQMLRTTDTGGVKMIYNGPYDETNKCNTSRGNHKVVAGGTGTTKAINSSYKYGDSFTYDESTNQFTLTSPVTTATWSDSTYESLIGKWTCASSSTTCTTLYNVSSYYSSTTAYTVAYTTTNKAYSIMGTSPFNANRLSPAMAGYMFNKVYNNKGSSAATSGSLFGASVSYSNGSYILTNTSTTKSNSRHYSCNNTTGTCSTVRFYYYNDYYLELSGGINIETALNQMLFNNDVNKYNSPVKGILEAWYNHELTDYTRFFEDAIYCNDRSLNSANNGWKESGSLTTTLRFKDYSSNTTLKCANQTDQFAVENTLAPNKYPIGLPTYPEMVLFDNATITTTGLGYLLNPIRYFGSQYAYYYYIDANGAPTTATVINSMNLRPVVSLKSSVEYISGDGSMTDPYVIDTDTRPKIITEVENGTITETSHVDVGGNKTISYSPDQGGTLQSILVDGEAVSISTYANSYTFTNVTGNHTIKVVYSLPNADITITNEIYGNMGSVNKDFTYTVTVRDGSDVIDPTLGGTFTLKNDESEVLSIPRGYKVTVEQTSESGYTTTVNNTAGRTITKTISADETITYKNTYDLSPDTEVRTILPPYIVLLLLSILTLLGIGYISKKLELD